MTAQYVCLKTKEYQQNLSAIYIGRNQNSINNIAWVKVEHLFAHNFVQCDGDSANHNTGQNRFFLWWLVELFAEGRNFDQTGSPADGRLLYESTFVSKV